MRRKGKWHHKSMLKSCAICSSSQCNKGQKRPLIPTTNCFSHNFVCKAIFLTESGGSWAMLIISIVSDTEILVFLCVITKAKGHKCASKSLHVEIKHNYHLFNLPYFSPVVSKLYWCLEKACSKICKPPGTVLGASNTENTKNENRCHLYRFQS